MRKALATNTTVFFVRPRETPRPPEKMKSQTEKGLRPPENKMENINRQSRGRAGPSGQHAPAGPRPVEKQRPNRKRRTESNATCRDNKRRLLENYDRQLTKGQRRNAAATRKSCYPVLSLDTSTTSDRETKGEEQLEELPRRWDRAHSQPAGMKSAPAGRS